MKTSFILAALFLCGAAHADDRAWIGSTRAEIHAHFAANIAHAVASNPQISATLGGMNAVELTRMATLLQQEGADSNGILQGIAQRSDAATLVRVATAFGSPITDSAVSAAAPAGIASAYFANKKATQLNAGLIAAPTLDMTLYEVYLDYLTTGLSVETSLAMTVSFAGQYLGASFVAGYQIGSGIYWLNDQINPTINQTIGAAVAGIANTLSLPSSAFAISTDTPAADMPADVPATPLMGDNFGLDPSIGWDGGEGSGGGDVMALDQED